MRLIKAVVIFTLLMWSAVPIQAQAGRVPDDPPAMVEASADSVADDQQALMDSGAMPAADFELGGGYLSEDAVASMRGASTRGAIIGALVGGIAAGTFLWHLREEGAVSPWRDGGAYRVVFTGAVIGGLIGAGIGALADR